MFITKKLRRIVVSAILSAGLYCAGTFASEIADSTLYRDSVHSIESVHPCSATAAEASDIYELLSDDMITFYEDEIAGERFITNMKPASLRHLSNKLGISVKKTKTLLLLCDFAQRNGDYININDISHKKDVEIIRLGKVYIDRYKSSLSEEEISQLKDKYKQLRDR